MKLTKKQRIALEFLAVVGPLWATPEGADEIFDSLFSNEFVTWRQGYLHITRKGREALKEATK